MVIPWRRKTSIILATSGRPPAAALETALVSRKQAGLIIAGEMTASCLASSLPKLSSRWMAPRGMQTAWPGARSFLAGSQGRRSCSM